MSRIILVLIWLLPAFSQQVSSGDQKKFLTVAVVGSHRSTDVVANKIVRGPGYPASIQLSGNVEIKTPVCLPIGAGRKPVCDGAMILRADEATLHEDTGEIEAHGNVHVTPLRHETAKK